MKKILFLMVALFSLNIMAMLFVEPYTGIALGTRKADSFTRNELMDETIGSVGLGLRFGVKYMNMFLAIDGAAHKTNIFDSVNKTYYRAGFSAGGTLPNYPIRVWVGHSLLDYAYTDMYKKDGFN